jgi:hypothetical protein
MEVIKNHKLIDEEEDGELLLSIGPKPKDHDLWSRHPDMKKSVSSKLYTEWLNENS